MTKPLKKKIECTRDVYLEENAKNRMDSKKKEEA